METQPQDNQFIEPLYQIPSLRESMMGEEPLEESEDYSTYTRQHDENLAQKLSQTEPHFLSQLGSKLCEEIEQDLESRKDWEDNIKKMFEQIGLKLEYKSFPFDGASGAYSPLMMQELVKSFAMTIAELLPQEGPAKNVIMGEPSEEIQQKAELLENFFNYYLLNEIEYYPDFERMMMWVNFSGSIVRKVYHDPVLQKINSKFISPYNFVVNYGTSDINSCWRKTEIYELDRREIARRQQTGEFLDVNIHDSDLEDDMSPIKQQVQRTEGITDPNYDTKILQDFYECHVFLDEEELYETDEEQDNEIEGEEPLKESRFRPYIVVIHKDTKKVLSLYRNWEENNPSEERKYFIDYGFIPGFGFYKLGAAHLIGGLTQTATQLLRQSLDAHTLSNFPAGVRVKGMQLPDNNVRLGPTEFKEIDTGGLPIRDAIMPMPYKEPSPMINEMRKDLENSGSVIMGTATSQLSDFNPNAPVGTTFALLDNILLIQSTITRGLRNSMTREFKLMYKRFSERMPEESFTFYRPGGKYQISKADFTDLVQIEPVADPHVTTKMQRLIRAQTIRDAAMQSPDLYDRFQTETMFLKELKIPQSEIDRVLPDKSKVMPLDPITENQNLIVGKGAVAGIDQDHGAHILLHQMLLSMPNASPITIEATNAHIAQHMALAFQVQMQNIMGGTMLPDQRDQIPPEEQNQIAQMAAQALMQYQQQQAENAPPPPIDPSVVLMEKVKVEDKAVEQRGKDTAMNTREKAFEAQLEYQSKEEDRKLRREELELKKLELEAKLGMGRV